MSYWLTEDGPDSWLIQIMFSDEDLTSIDDVTEIMGHTSKTRAVNKPSQPGLGPVHKLIKQSMS